MITDEILEAIDMMIQICDDAEHRKGMDAIREMLCDFEELEWSAANEEDRKSWITQFLNRELY